MVGRTRRMEMGFRRAFDRALGRAPVTASTRIAIVALVASLAGCSVIGDISGAVAGIAAGPPRRTLLSASRRSHGQGGMDSAGKYVSRSANETSTTQSPPPSGRRMSARRDRGRSISGDRRRPRRSTRRARDPESSLAMCKEVVFSVVETSDPPASPAGSGRRYAATARGGPGRSRAAVDRGNTG